MALVCLGFMSWRWQSFLVVCYVSLSLCWLPVALAYVLPADMLCRYLAESRLRANQRDITLQLTADLAGRDHPIDERLYIKKPERCRLVSLDDTISVLIDKEGKTALGDDKTWSPSTYPSANFLVHLLIPQGKNLDDLSLRLLWLLKSVGIDTNQVSLGRLNDSFVYVIGAQAWEVDKPQIWLDKNNFMPVYAVLFKQQNQQTIRVELRLQEYGVAPAPAGIPRVFEVYENKQLVRHAEVAAAQINQNLPETLFELLPRRSRR